MSQASPKGNLLNVFLFAAMIFLGIQLFFQKPAPEPRDSAKILAEMRSMNSKVLDISIVSENSKLANKVNEEVAAKKLDKQQGERIKLEGTLLVGNTQYRGGVIWNEMSRFTSAFNTLHNIDRANQNNRFWTTEKIQLGPNKKFPESEINGRDFTKKVVDELSEKSKTDLVFGLFPGYKLIDALVAVTGRVSGFSYWFAAMLLALVVRLAVFPLAAKQYKFGRMMGQLSPLMTELREEYTDKKTKQVTNPMELQQKTMALYGEYGINPMQGCWPMFIQIPFFLLIYQCMLHYQFEFQKGLFLWVNPGTSAATNGFIAPNLGERDYILIGLYAVSMVVTTLMAPVTTSDPAQAKQGKIMGVGIAVLFSVMMFFWPLPSAFVLYWVFTNIFATAHMLYAYRQPLPPLQKVNAPSGGLFPITGMMGQKGAKTTNGTPSTNGTPKVRTGTPVKHRPKKKK